MQLRAREDFYRQLYTMLDAGIGIRHSLAKLQPRTPGRLGKAVGRLVTAVEQGDALGETLRAAPRGDFGPDEVELIATGELIGCLPDVVRRLCESFAFRRKLRREILGALAYPMLLLHAALVIPPLPLLFTHSVNAYLVAAGSGIASLYLLFLAFIGVWQATRVSPLIARTVERVLLAIPGLGGIVGGLARARWLRALADLHGAGMLAHQALAAAARASGSVILQEKLAPATQAAADGTPISEAIAMTGVLDETQLAIIETGETAGKLDETMGKVADEAAETAKIRTRYLAKFLTGAVYALAMIYVAWNVVGAFVGGYVGALRSLGG